MVKDTEQILIASWLHGRHTDDMKMFSAADFTVYGSIYGCLESGETDPIAIADITDMNPMDIARIASYDQEFLYESAVRDLSRRQARRWLDENDSASPREIAEAMKRFDRNAVTVPKAPDDPVLDLQDEFDRRRSIPFVATGLAGLDYMMNGIRRKELTSVGARPSVGKSAFCQQIAMEVAKHEHKVLYFPLEMSEISVLERMFMRYTNVSQYEVRTGLKNNTWKSEEVKLAFDKMQAVFDKGNLLIFERCNDLQVIQELIRIHEPFMIVIDQLEQLKDGKRSWEDKRSRFSHMTHELQGIAMDMNVAVWLACQVNRSADNSPPTLANLKESGSIEEDSDNVILLHRDGDKTTNQRIILDLAKQRGGECGQVPLAYIAPKFAFYGQENRY